VGKKLHDEHFSVFKSAWSRVRFLVAGRNSRSTPVPSESKFGDRNRRSGTADRSVHTAVFGAGDLSAVALDRASIEIICGSTMSRRAEFAAMMQIGRATAVQPKVI
jgi:hypothetical protein